MGTSRSTLRRSRRAKGILFESDRPLKIHPSKSLLKDFLFSSFAQIYPVHLRLFYRPASCLHRNTAALFKISSKSIDGFQPGYDLI